MAEKTISEKRSTAAAATSAPTFHHVGFAVASIAETAADIARSLSAEWTAEIIHDPLQQARVSFMRCAGPDTPAVELVEPDSETSPLNKFLSKGGGLHHICYEVDSLESQLDYCRSAGSLIVGRPLPAVAFGGRRIAWTYTKQRLLVEYLER